ncbi:MAG: hypothetical protein IKO06_06580 [Alphaproteobacteria bacterium]|nr:hypothetical protein [Alphaproteobacteria bacterium]
MKSLLVFIRIIVVGGLWGIVFTEGIRVIMLCNWHFDIFWPDHWRQLRELWRAGWTVRAPKEWAFVILLFTFIPMLITGWWTICLVAWEELIYKALLYPVNLYKKLFKSPVAITSTANKYGVVKRKSYKQIRPAGINALHAPISDYGDTTRAAIAQASANAAYPYGTAYAQQNSLSAAASRVATKIKKPDVAATIDHALFKFDDEEDDFDLDIDSFEKADIKKAKTEDKKKTTPHFNFDDDDEDDIVVERNVSKAKSKRKKATYDDDDDNQEVVSDSKPKKRQKEEKVSDEKSAKRDKNTRDSGQKENKSERRREEQRAVEGNTSHSPVFDSLQQKNYDIVSNIKVKDTVINYIGVAKDEICLCLVDNESGDWLADEEMFNGEEPLWFSESSHRVSPVCLLNNARNTIKEALDDAGFELNVKSFVVIQMANIINADDMFDVWDDMGINVTRINRGAPKEIHLFSKTILDADEKMNKKELERLKKVLQNLA